MRLAMVLAVVLAGGNSYAEPSTCKAERTEFRRLAVISEKTNDVIDTAATEAAGRDLTACENAHPSEKQEIATKIDAKPKLQRMILSAAICAIANWRKSSLDGLAIETKYERETGVVRLGNRNKLRTSIEAADRFMVAARRLLRDRKGTATACTDKMVKALWPCFAEGPPAMCSLPMVEAMTDWASAVGAWPDSDDDE